MKKAEKRASVEGKVIADGTVPMMYTEISHMEKAEQIKKPYLFISFVLPLLIIIVIAVGSFMKTGTPKILEAFMVASFYLGGVLWLQKVTIREIMQAAIGGIKGVMPAVIILVLAFAINSISKDLGTAIYVIELTKSWLTPLFLPILTFGITALIAFSTGTSWGTYAIMIPIAIPMAFQFSCGEITSLPLATIAAVAGGAVFGDHASPLSDTTILSSLGAASDHIEHVKTQIPYAMLAAGVSMALYFIIGCF
jgi:Na+/H+ antiporter NhaC